MAAGIEVELKLRAEDDEPLRALAVAQRLGSAALGPLVEVDELDRYLDTADGHLAAAHWACRLRSRGESLSVSLKGPAQHEPGAALHRRPEVEGPADASLEPDGWPPSDARARLRELSGGRPLVERLSLRQLRGERAVMVGQAEIGTLSLDRVTVLHDGRPRGAFLAVELELRAGPHAEELAGQLLEALQAVPGLAPEPRSKLERALELATGAG
jgi:inorganic triphosphatase YgiF